MWSVASSTAAFDSMASDIGIIFGIVIMTVFGTLAALYGLGFGIRKAQQYVTGKKF